MAWRRWAIASAAAAITAVHLAGLGGCVFRPDPFIVGPARTYYVCLEKPPPTVPHTVDLVVCSTTGGWAPFCGTQSDADALCQQKGCVGALHTDAEANLARLYEWDINAGLVTCGPTGRYLNTTPDPKDKVCVDVSHGAARAVPAGTPCQGPALQRTDVYYCVYPNPNASCDKASAPALTIAPPYRATLLALPTAFVQSDEDPSQQGVAIGRPGLPSLQFDRGPGGLTIWSMVLPVNDFEFGGQHRLQGSVALTTPGVTAAPAATGYVIPGGAATFHVVGVDEEARTYQLDATNSTPLTISSVDGVAGPRVEGRLEGALDGHPVHADLSAVFAWINRPPVAIAHAANVVFDSSKMRPCNRRPDAPQCQQVTHCKCSQGTHDMKWVGLAGASTIVALDASASYDPDAGDSLLYAWNGFPAGTQPMTGRAFTPGRHTVLLTTQDDYGTAAMTSVTFKVTDKAQPSCRCPEWAAIGPPDAAFEPQPIAEDLPPIRGPISPDTAAAVDAVQFVASQEASTALGPRSLPDVEGLVGCDQSALAARLFRQATTRAFGKPELRTAAVADPLATFCAGGRTSALCEARCGNGRCEASEGCATCPTDCGTCGTCNDGRCAPEESCATCPADCGRCDTCGNGVCDPRESTRSCARDCRCGNGTCDPGENGKRCPRDCYCGNGVCDPGEDGGSCRDDCRCGNGTCDAGETRAICARDCGCGDGFCDPRETCRSCRADCPGSCRSEWRARDVVDVVCGWFARLFD